jgi:hypothetical protein
MREALVGGGATQVHPGMSPAAYLTIPIFFYFAHDPATVSGASGVSALRER